MMNKAKRVISIFGLLIILASFFLCADVSAGDKAPVKDSPHTAASENDMVFHLKKYTCIDTQGIGCEAFSLLITSEWKFDGGIKWSLDNPAMPAVAQFTVKNPDGAEELEVFPNQAMFWTSNQMLLATFPVGSRYFGAEVRPVADPISALTQIALPRFRAKVSGLKIVNKKNLPELAKALGAGSPQPGVQTFANAAKVRIEYLQDGISLEEEIFAVVEGFNFSFQAMQGTITNTNWCVDYIFSFKAQKGKLDSTAALFQTMVNSFKINPVWFNKYNQTVNFLIQAQIQQIRSVGELSRIISKTSNEISDSMMKSYQDRQKVYDRISEDFSEYVRGTEHYNNPFEGCEVELPGGYNHVWTNAGGEYVFTDSPSYNPNIDSNKNWEEIQKK